MNNLSCARISTTNKQPKIGKNPQTTDRESLKIRRTKNRKFCKQGKEERRYGNKKEKSRGEKQ
jgi:hypothetical protein